MNVFNHIEIESKFHSNKVVKDVGITSYLLTTLYPNEWLNTHRKNKGCSLFYCYINNVLYPLYIEAEEDDVETAMSLLIAEMKRIGEYNPYGWELPEWLK